LYVFFRAGEEKISPGKIQNFNSNNGGGFVGISSQALWPTLCHSKV